MDVIKIASLNCHNTKKDNKKSLNRKATMLSNHIKENDYDILATQELTGSIVSRINQNLKEYKMYGKYRFGNNILTKHIQILKQFNENNNIITKYKVIYQITKRLPWIPRKLKDLLLAIKKRTIMPRIVTLTIIKINDKKICAISTHLDYKVEEIQIRQLRYLEKLIRKYNDKYDIVLMGDFNMETTKSYFKEFIDYLNGFDIIRVPIDEKTNASRFRTKDAIDHIFIPNKWEVIEYGTKDDQLVDGITDHKEVYVKVKMR